MQLQSTASPCCTLPQSMLSPSIHTVWQCWPANTANILPVWSDGLQVCPPVSRPHTLRHTSTSPHAQLCHLHQQCSRAQTQSHSVLPGTMTSLMYTRVLGHRVPDVYSRSGSSGAGIITCWCWGILWKVDVSVCFRGAEPGCESCPVVFIHFIFYYHQQPVTLLP